MIFITWAVNPRALTKLQGRTSVDALDWPKHAEIDIIIHSKYFPYSDLLKVHV